MKNATIIIGGCWGDEGKGKVASKEAQDASLVIRATGGANAGHTIIFRGEKIALHLIPGGIVYPQATSLIGQGVVIDPKMLIDEVDTLTNYGIPFVKKRLKISGRAHLVMPYHKHLDALYEKMKDNPIGTTGRGIGPAYIDKKSRVGLRVYDLFLPTQELAKKIDVATRMHYQLFKLNGMEEAIIDPLVIAKQYHEYAQEIGRNAVINADILTDEVCKNGEKIVVEGAQAYRLDNDYGDYQDVTSSNCVVTGTLLGAHLSHKSVDKVVIIGKAYCSRVGNGVFPTEQEAHIANDQVLPYDEPFIGDIIREAGGEYGASTGRPRRTGWGDAVLLKSACAPSTNDADYLCINHLDTLGKIGKIVGSVKIATSYNYQSRTIQFYPDDMRLTGETPVPVYKEFEGGWDIPSNICDYEELPDLAKEYIETIEHVTRVPVKYIGIGPGNDDMIIREEL